MDNLNEILRSGTEVRDTDDDIWFSVSNRTVLTDHEEDIVVKKDNISRNIHFKINRYFEEDDLFAKDISIRYVNAKNEYDEYIVYEKQLIQDENGKDIITFVWNITDKVTVQEGDVTYDILFFDTETGYKWHTKPMYLRVEQGLQKTDQVPTYVVDLYEVWRNEATKNIEESKEIAEKAVANIEPTIEKYVVAEVDEKMKDYKQDKAPYEKVLLYYGYPIAINGAWTVENAVNIYRTYDICVFGDTYENPEQEVYESTCAILKRLKEVSPETKIVGYVPIGLDPNWADSNLSMEELKIRVDRWLSIGADGIFLDEFGYDYYVTRERQNEIVGYCHDKGMFVFANSWSIQYVFSPEVMEIDWLPDFHPNPNGLAPLINENDYYLYENLFYTAEEISGVLTLQCASVWRINDVLGYFTRPEIDGKSYYEVYKTKVCSLDAIPSNLDINTKNILQSITCIGAAILNINAVAFGDEHWGSTGYYHHWDLPALELGHDGLNGVSEETKTYTNADGEESSFPYKWSANINGQTYAVVFDIPDPDHREWVDGMRYCTDNGVIIENAWMSIFDFQTVVREASEKADAAIATAEQIKTEVDNVMPTLATAEENIKKVVAEAQASIDEATTQLEAGLADLKDVTAGFGFKEAQW